MGPKSINNRLIFNAITGSDGKVPQANQIHKAAATEATASFGSGIAREHFDN